MDKLKINYDLLPMKSHYLFINADLRYEPFDAIFTHLRSSVGNNVVNGGMDLFYAAICWAGVTD
ncbi:unnamed protein product [Notodromas monacha]|uniref:Uncharacterized protein n=1 Tax=Notodromas monacha TaxID=399045 RepID=A0A7R9G9F0_9CRUS|nr:unnamed protein product [Notodromas monacha]CAG0914196.1 unnamed protein product [Notodromas monacha]